MTCPRCARDLLAQAVASSDPATVAQCLREAITEWDHPGEAQALRGMLARLEQLGQWPEALGYWLAVAARRVDGPPLPPTNAEPNQQTYEPKPCGHCPGGTT